MNRKSMVIQLIIWFFYLKKCTSISLSLRLWLCRCVFPILFRRCSPGSDCVLSNTNVTYKTHQVYWLHNCHVQLIWHRLCAMWTSSSVVEFWLFILWLLVQSPVGEIMVNSCPVVLYDAHSVCWIFWSW